MIIQPQIPIIIFNHIPDIKEDHQHLDLLAKMDFLVIDKHGISPVFLLSEENKRKKGNPCNFRIFEKFMCNNDHETKINKKNII